jgi:hypothetical protein
MKFTIRTKDPSILLTLQKILAICDKEKLLFHTREFLCEDGEDGFFLVDCEGTENHLAFFENYFGKENILVDCKVTKNHPTFFERCFGKENVTKEEEKPMNKIFVITDDLWYAKEAYAHESVARAKAARHNLLFKDDPNETERVMALPLIDEEPKPSDKREYNFRCRVHICHADKNIYLDDVVYTYEGPSGFEATSAREFVGVIPIMDQRVLDQVFRLSYEKLGSPLGSINDFTWIIDEEDMLK